MNEQTIEALAAAKNMRPITVKAQGARRTKRDVLPMLVAALRGGPAKRSDLLRALRGVTAAQLDEAADALAADGVLVWSVDARGHGRPAKVLALSDAGSRALALPDL